MAEQICPDCGHDMCRAHWLHLDAHGHVDDAYTRVVTAECRERMSKLIAAKDAELARLRVKMGCLKQIAQTARNAKLSRFETGPVSTAKVRAAHKLSDKFLAVLNDKETP